MSERIVLSLELVEGDREARCCIRVPDDAVGETIFGPWLDLAIKDLRAQCKAKIKEALTDNARDGR